MWAVKTRTNVLAIFDDLWEAEEWMRTWRSIHGHRVYLTRTEN
jgi:hypothetical protein